MRRLAAALIAAAMPFASASSEPVRRNSPSPYEGIVPGSTSAQACFHKSFDAQYLKAHPHQVVKEMSILLRVQGFRDGKMVTSNADNIEMRFAGSMLRRSDHKPATNNGACDEDKASCHVNCDGGSFDMEKTATGIQLTPTDGGLGFNAYCDEPDPRSPYFGRRADEKSIELESAPMEKCREIEKILSAK